MGVRNFMKYLEEIGYLDMVKSMEKEILKEESKFWFFKNKKRLKILNECFMHSLIIIEKNMDNKN